MTQGNVGDLSAFIDESGSYRSLDPNTYILAAAIYDAEASQKASAAMRGLLLPGQVKVHWHDEDERRRLKLVNEVAGLEGVGLIVVRNGLPGEKDERRRRLCGERMYYELQQRGVQNAVFESRGPADDRRDRKHLDSLKASRRITGSFRVDHLAGRIEPLLWVPDIFCGALSQARTGNETYIERLGELVDIITLEA
ncbi:conserved hypothetical protein [Arthrobacter sp. Hiyo1]|uniref:hypothetical protein n=1 Tax=Arthrobacter sp. Hiyo1 TaxID=1588020 RepID=UPI0006A3ABA5|nr:hypothetical protein [Arthrobacter sp. Hiyo1]GAP61413.1 conserved hypothetical protein [Arthrobacter sp. Hiyo1]